MCVHVHVLVHVGMNMCNYVCMYMYNMYMYYNYVIM